MSIKKETYFGKAISKGFKGSNDDLNWCIASAEVADFENDIVDIGSLSLSRHTPEHPIPVLASHLKKLPDGTFPVIGSVVEWAKGITTTTDGKEVEALFAGWAWADKENPDLVSKIKPLYPRLVNNFSISFIPNEDEVYQESPQLGNNSPTRYKECTVTELSLTLVGANPHAMALKELNKSLGDLLDIKEMKMTKKDMADGDGAETMNMSYKKDMDELMASYQKSTNDLYTNQMQEMVTKNSECLAKCFADHMKSMNDRFDALESSIAAMTFEDGDFKEAKDSKKVEATKELEEVKKALENLSKRFSK